MGFSIYCDVFKERGVWWIVYEVAPALRAELVHVVQSVIEDLAAETSTGSSNAREAERKTGIPERSIQRILHGMLDLHPYKIEALH